jgi:hypothetical protein
MGWEALLQTIPFVVSIPHPLPSLPSPPYPASLSDIEKTCSEGYQVIYLKLIYVYVLPDTIISSLQLES